MAKKILIIGAGGRLGKDFLKYMPNTIGLNHKDCNITDKKSIFKAIKKYKPKIVINCAGLTDINYCEDFPIDAYYTNVYGTKNLTEICNICRVFLVHISSDYAIEPVNEYSWTKLLSEVVVGRNENMSMVIRCSYYNEDYWLIKDLQKRKKIKVLRNYYFNPISSLNLIKTIERLIKLKSYGYFNIGTSEKINYEDFAYAICKIFKLNYRNIKPITNIDWKVRRPKDTYLNLQKLNLSNIGTFTIIEDLQCLRHVIKNKNNNKVI